MTYHDLDTFAIELPSSKQLMDLIDFTDTWRVLYEVAEERERQDLKWGMQKHTPLEWVSIESEEMGEWATAVNKGYFGCWNQDRLANLREEMIQTAAVAVCAVEDFDRQLVEYNAHNAHMDYVWGS